MSDDTSDTPMVVDFREIYKFGPEDIHPDISVVRYSNLSYIQCTHRDIFIDFLEMPGVKKDGKMVVNGTRIYMSHAAAQKVAEALSGILDKVHEKGDMETFTTTGKKQKISTKAKLSLDKKQI